jgi:hypothetical protein
MNPKSRQGFRGPEGRLAHPPGRPGGPAFPDAHCRRVVTGRGRRCRALVWACKGSTAAAPRRGLVSCQAGSASRAGVRALVQRHHGLPTANKPVPAVRPYCLRARQGVHGRDARGDTCHWVNNGEQDVVTWYREVLSRSLSQSVGPSVNPVKGKTAPVTPATRPGRQTPRHVRCSRPRPLCPSCPASGSRPALLPQPISLTTAACHLHWIKMAIPRWSRGRARPVPPFPPGAPVAAANLRHRL